MRELPLEPNSTLWLTKWAKSISFPFPPQLKCDASAALPVWFWFLVPIWQAWWHRIHLPDWPLSSPIQLHPLKFGLKKSTETSQCKPKQGKQREKSSSPGVHMHNRLFQNFIPLAQVPTVPLTHLKILPPAPWSPASVVPIGKSCCNQGTLQKNSNLIV